MSGIVPDLRWSSKDRLRRNVRQCQTALERTHYLIIINLLNGRTALDTAAALGVGRATVYRVAKRFREDGEAGLVDRREENGNRKLDESYLTKLNEVVAYGPQDYGWRRPTWTRELLVETMWWETDTRVHASTMSTALAIINARRGRPKPTVGCPWPNRAKNKRLRKIQQLIKLLPSDEVVVYEDEVDIHLNPKIGLDWMVHGQQKEVLTPGKNVKRYLAGAIDAKTGELIWAERDSKNTLLFINLLWKLVDHYDQASVIHVILDNYSIHSTRQVQVSLATTEGRRIRLHFLPPTVQTQSDRTRLARSPRQRHTKSSLPLDDRTDQRSQILAQKEKQETAKTPRRLTKKHVSKSSSAI